MFFGVLLLLFIKLGTNGRSLSVYVVYCVDITVYLYHENAYRENGSIYSSIADNTYSSIADNTYSSIADDTNILNNNNEARGKFKTESP